MKPNRFHTGGQMEAMRTLFTASFTVFTIFSRPLPPSHKPTITISGRDGCGGLIGQYACHHLLGFPWSSPIPSPVSHQRHWLTCGRDSMPSDRSQVSLCSHAIPFSYHRHWLIKNQKDNRISDRIFTSASFFSPVIPPPFPSHQDLTTWDTMAGDRRSGHASFFHSIPLVHHHEADPGVIQ